MSEEKTVSANLTVTMSDIQREMELLRLEREKLSVERNIVALDELRNTADMPKSMNGKLALAAQLAKSYLVPEAFRGKPDDIFLAFTFAEMIGIMSPISALMNVYVVQGKPSTSSDSMIGICMVQPEFLDYEHEIIVMNPPKIKIRVNKAKKGDSANWQEIEVENLKSISRITRKMPNGKERVFEREHTTEMSAERFGVFPQWISDQRNMIKHRSDGKVARTAFPANFSGIHTPDELNDYENSIEVQDGSGNKTGTIKKESLRENVVNDDIFSTASVKEV